MNYSLECEKKRLLGIQIGSKFLFNNTSDFPIILQQLAVPGLAQWRSSANSCTPLTSDDLPPGTELKESLFDLDTLVTIFLRHT